MQQTTTLSPRARHLPTVETQRLRRLLAAKGLREVDIDDAVQEVHLRVLRSGPEGAGLTPWVTRVAINVAMDHHRRQRRARRLGQKLAATSRATVPDHDVVDRLAITAALAELAPENRAVISLHLLAGLTIAETARRLAVPEGTVKSRLHRAAGRAPPPAGAQSGRLS